MRDERLGVPDWNTRPLSEVCTLISRGFAPAYTDDSRTKVIGQRCVRNSGFDASMARFHDVRFSRVLAAKSGDILLNSTGTGTIGRSCVFPEKLDAYIVDSHVTVLRPGPSVDPRWINAILMSNWGQHHLESHCYTGSTNQIELSRIELARTRIPCPPLVEQQRIADILDVVDDQIRAIQDLIAKLTKSLDGATSQLIRGDISTAGGNQRTGKLGDFIHLQRGFDITAAEQQEGDVPVISSSGVTSYHNIAMVKGPGVIIGRKGKLGNAYHVDGDFWPHDTTLWVTDFKGNDPKFIARLLKWMRLERLDAATSVPTLNRNFVHPLKVRIPYPDEQRRIVTELEGWESRIQSEEAELAKLRTIKQGLMDDLLTGRVRVSVLCLDVEGAVRGKAIGGDEDLHEVIVEIFRDCEGRAARASNGLRRTEAPGACGQLREQLADSLQQILYRES